MIPGIPFIRISSEAGGAQCRRPAAQCSVSLKHVYYERCLFRSEYWNLFTNLSPVSHQEPLICTLILRVDEMKMKKEMGPLFYSQPIFLVIF